MPKSIIKDKSILKMFIDQYGYKYFAHTRKELIKAVCPYGSPKVSKMYVDDKNGNSFFVGYIIGDHWCTANLPIKESIN